MKMLSKKVQSRVMRLEKLLPRELMAIDMAALLRPGNFPTYSVDGTGNNIAQVEWGSTQEDLLRLARAEYEFASSRTPEESLCHMARNCTRRSHAAISSFAD
jgi:hypothetical protein